MNLIDILLSKLRKDFISPTDEVNTPQIPPQLIYAGSLNKRGVSPRELAKEIILAQADAGAPIGALPDGSESIEEKMEFIRVEKIIKHFMEHAVFTVSIPPGTRIQGFGIGADGVPVKVDGITTEFSTGYAILQ